MEFSNVEQRTKKFPSIEPALDRSFLYTAPYAVTGKRGRGRWNRAEAHGKALPLWVIYNYSAHLRH